MTRLLPLLCALLPACGAPTYNYSKEPDPRKREFVIGAADRVRITVWKNNDLATEQVVRPDGTVTMPLLGDVHVIGLTPTELKQEITTKLMAFVKDESAVVTVAVTDVASYRFTVGGNVEHPGVFSTKYFVTAAEAVALAGGLNKFASPKRLVIIRQEPNQPMRRVPIDFTRIGGGDHPEENIVLLAGDTLFVP